VHGRDVNARNTCLPRSDRGKRRPKRLGDWRDFLLGLSRINPLTLFAPPLLELFARPMLVQPGALSIVRRQPNRLEYRDRNRAVRLKRSFVQRLDELLFDDLQGIGTLQRGIGAYKVIRLSRAKSCLSLGNTTIIWLSLRTGRNAQKPAGSGTPTSLTQMRNVRSSSVGQRASIFFSSSAENSVLIRSTFRQRLRVLKEFVE